MIAALVVVSVWACCASLAAWVERRGRQISERNHLLTLKHAELLRQTARRWELEAQQLADMAARPHITSHGVVRRPRHV